METHACSGPWGEATAGALGPTCIGKRPQHPDLGRIQPRPPPLPRAPPPGPGRPARRITRAHQISGGSRRRLPLIQSIKDSKIPPENPISLASRNLKLAAGRWQKLAPVVAASPALGPAVAVGRSHGLILHDGRAKPQVE